MDIRAGTSGYAYKEWRQVFYPENLRQADWLSFYGNKLPAVEINSTYYRLPRAATLSSWAEAVPEGFQFALKASRKITHFAQLRGADEAVEYLFQVIQALGERLGPLLFQLPPTAKADAGVLRDFLARIPRNRRAAFEFRNQSWFNDRVYQLLADANAALCLADADQNASPRVATTDWLYLRLRRSSYDDASLGDWLSWVTAQDCSCCYAFFKHESDEPAFDFARRLLELSDESR